MTLRFKPIREGSVMCTMQGCSEVAQFFLAAAVRSAANARPIPQAYCQVHAQDAAKRLGQPWPTPENKVAGSAAHQAKYMAG
jgi:hypothetical protein